MNVQFDLEIKEGSNVVIPICVHVGKKEVYEYSDNELKAMIEALKEKKCEVTILLADTLDRHNSDYDTAYQAGNKFLEDNKEILCNVKVVRWEERIKDKKPEIESARNALKSKLTEGSPLQNKMVRTHKRCAISTSIEKSMLYQTEEYEVFLSMAEFDYHLCKKPATAGMAQLYKEFPEIKKPVYVQTSFQGPQASNIKNIGIFKDNKNNRNQNNLVLPLRMAYEQLKTVLQSPEIASAQKAIFKEKIENLFAMLTETSEEEITQVIPIGKNPKLTVN